MEAGGHYCVPPQPWFGVVFYGGLVSVVLFNRVTEVIGRFFWLCLLTHFSLARAIACPPVERRNNGVTSFCFSSNLILFFAF